MVDNGRQPALRRRWSRSSRRSAHDVELVSLGSNCGFGPAANVGPAPVPGSDPGDRGDWVAVAPHDALPQPGALARLVELAESVPGVGLACADVGDGHVPVVDPYFGGMTRPAAQTEGLEPADYPHGTLLVARRACLAEIGLFDERFFAYCEEADLGLRATAAGWGVGLAHGARVVNPGMRSGSPVVDYLMHRNTLHLVRRHFGRYHAFVRLLIGVSQLVRGIVSALVPRLDVLGARPDLGHHRLRAGPHRAAAVADDPGGRRGAGRDRSTRRWAWPTWIRSPARPARSPPSGAAPASAPERSGARAVAGTRPAAVPERSRSRREPGPDGDQVFGSMTLPLSASATRGRTRSR